jgi:hypothetical protein
VLDDRSARRVKNHPSKTSALVDIQINPERDMQK